MRPGPDTVLITVLHSCDHYRSRHMAAGGHIARDDAERGRYLRYQRSLPCFECWKRAEEGRDLQTG